VCKLEDMFLICSPQPPELVSSPLQNDLFVLITHHQAQKHKLKNNFDVRSGEVIETVCNKIFDRGQGQLEPGQPNLRSAGQPISMHGSAASVDDSLLMDATRDGYGDVQKEAGRQVNCSFLST